MEETKVDAKELAKRMDKRWQSVTSFMMNCNDENFQLCKEAIGDIVKDRNNETNKSFIPPTLEQVIAYCRERKNNIDPYKFFNYYGERNWTWGDNRAPIKDWKRAVITWETKEKQWRG